MSLARAERAALSDTLDRTDPGQPTLCAGWIARDLLAHLLVRERQPWASGGIVIPFLAPLTERAMQGYADTAWTDMVEQLRCGPPAWSPSRVGRVDEAVNGAELFVHHEDVRRGRPGWVPRGADETRNGALWDLVTRMGRLFYRRSPVGVVVRRPTGAQAVIKTGRPRRTSSWWTNSSAPFTASSTRPIRDGDQAGGPERSCSTMSFHAVSA